MRRNTFVTIAFVILLPCGSQAQARLPQGPPGTVTLPVADYDRLVDRASQPQTQTDMPPVAAVVARADLRARVAADLVRGTLRLDGEVLARGHVKVPLVTGATLIEARADGRPIPLLRDGDTHAAVLAGPSPFAITIEWTVPLAAAPGRASFPLPVPAGGTLRASVDLPGDPADVRVEPGVITRRDTAAGRTAVDVTLQPGRQAQISWSVRETAADAPPAEVRTLADVKSLVTIGDADLRLVSLIDITVVRGAPRTFEVRVPPGFDLVSVSGTSLDSSDAQDGSVTLTVRDPSPRRHQFLLSLEQTHSAGSFKVDTTFPAVPGAQREIGEAAIEADGIVDVAASGDEGLRRMDVREIPAALRSLARQPLLAAFRYQRRQAETRVLTIEVKRFTDAPVIAAAAERAVATTLVTVEGRMLTEVQLTVRNRAQPFMKVTLPAGAAMLSVEVAGETARPVFGPDGTRVPLLRTGFRPDGPYTVSFVYLHAGEAFRKRGHADMTLPAMDVPVSVVEWELFLPDRLAARPTAGNVIPAHLVGGISHVIGYNSAPRRSSSEACGERPDTRPIGATQIAGRIVDQAGCALPGATVTLRAVNGVRETITDENGFYVFHSVPSGRVHVKAELSGFKAVERSFVFDRQARRLDLILEVGALTETVTVMADAEFRSGAPREEALQQVAPSQNVLALQRRVSGVLPVRIDVPRTGAAYLFVRPLVLDEETRVTFRYKRR